MSSRRPPATLVCGAMALSAGAQVVAGFGAGPMWWQMAGGVVAMLLAGLATSWTMPAAKKISDGLFNNPYRRVGAAH